MAGLPLDGADTIIVPGLNDPTRPLAPDVRDALRRCHQAGKRITATTPTAYRAAFAGS